MLRYSAWVMRIALAPLFFLSFSAPAAGQPCSVVGSPQDTMLPSGTATSPTNPDLSLGNQANYLYALGQWGLLRTPLAPPDNPGSYQIFQVGAQANGGVIPIHCDCYQGFNAFEVVDAPDGTSRMLTDWVPYTQGGQPPPPPNSNFSGLPAQLGQTTGAGAPAFGQQIDLPHSVPLGARLAAVYINSNPPKYIGYLPVAGQGVYMADLSSPTGDPGYQNPISPSSAIGWMSPVGSTSARLKAAHVTVPGYDKYLLAGSTSDLTLHVAEINTDINNGPIGTPVEVPGGSISTLANPVSMDIAVIDQRIFIFSAEGFQGLRVYEYQPPPAAGQPAQMSFVTQIITGKIMRALVRGSGSVLLLHRVDPTTLHSFIDLYGTDWVTQPNPNPPSSPGLSIPHFGAADANYLGWGADVKIPPDGDTAYLYRIIVTAPEESIRTQTLNLSCLVNPNSPPTASIENGGTNASFGYRTDHTNYLGDLWSFQADSISPPSAPTTGVQWDINVTSNPPLPDFGGIQGWPQGSRLPPSPPATVTFPCDPNPPVNTYPAGNPTDANGLHCWESVGSPSGGPDFTASFSVGVQTVNANGSSQWAQVSQSVKAPQISLFGLQGTVLHILDGGTNNGDASQSQGNIQANSPGHATFAWTVGTSNASPTIGQALQCPVQTLQGNGSTNTIPGSTIEPTNCPFTLTVTYNGGYNVSTSGTLSQDGLVAEFSLPTQVVLPGPLALTNLSRKLTTTNAGSPSYAISLSSSGGAILSGPLPAFGWGPPDPSGTTELGTGTQQDVDISALTAGNYTVTLTYPYGAGLVATVSHSFDVVDVPVTPTLGIFQTAAQTGPVLPYGQPPTFYLTTGRTYYLFDVETNFPPNSDAAFYSSASSNELPTAGGRGPATFTATTACSTCNFRVVVNGQAGVFPYNVSGGGGGCGNNCGGGTPTLTLMPAQPGSPKVGDLVTFAAIAQNFTGNVGYQWDFGDSAPANCSNPNPAACQGDVTAFAAGPNPNTHAYAAAGTYTVTVQASGGNGSRTASQVITVTGLVAPVATFSTSTGTWQGPVKTAIAFTAGESHAASWDWDFGDNTPHGSGQTVVHTYESTGPYTVTLTVTGDGTNTTAQPVSASQSFTVFDPKILTVGQGGRFQVRADWSSSSQGTSGEGTAVQLTPDSGYFWFFNPTNVEVVAKVLDGCNVNGHYWVFVGGLTSLEVQFTVLDTVTNVSKVYNNSEGTAFVPIQDTLYEACSTGGVHVAQAATTAPSVTLGTPSPANPTVNDTVNFVATASGFTGTVQYAWDFDGCIHVGCTPTVGPSDGTNSHRFAAPGSYDVTVVATVPGTGQLATNDVTVTVGASTGPPPPSAAYSIPSGATRTSPSSPWVAAVNVPVTFTALETHGTYLWDFGDPASGADNSSTLQNPTHTFTTTGNKDVKLTVTGDGTNTSGTSTATIRMSVTDPYTLRLTNGRFAVTADWATGSGTTATSGHGTATSLTSDTGYFWFFNASNTEVIIKVLDACSIDGHFWVFASGLTNLGVTLTVTDTQSGTSHQYTNADGTAFAPVQDFGSFRCTSP